MGLRFEFKSDSQLNSGNHLGALEHCDRVLAAPEGQVEPAIRAKALHRRAQALRRLDRLHEALEAYRCGGRKVWDT